MRFIGLLFLAALAASVTTYAGSHKNAVSGSRAPTILITGSNRGIGLEFARQYAKAGWNVIATTRDPAKAAQLQALDAEYPNLTVKALDLTDHKQIDQLGAQLVAQPIDILLNNAALLGDYDDQLFGAINYEQFEQILSVNTIGTLKVTEAFIDNVRLGKQKKIITLGSAAGSIGALQGKPDLYAYRASKTALNMLMRNLALDVADEGIVVGLFNPGLVDTRGFAEMLAGEQPTPANFEQIVKLLKSGAVELSTPEEAVNQMMQLAEEIGPAQSGMFLNADGQPIPW
jgi:NAD(P)-dependent dehydrogenase (short-subunit alcohol dehydrogenase family)